MLLLKQGDTGAKIIVTLQEKTTLSNPFYLFVFQHITTKEVVRFIKGPADELSTATVRYNEYAVDATIFPTVGQWLYKVYEQESATNTDETGLNEVERGKMDLQDEAEAKTEYKPNTSYIAYAG